MNRYSFKFLVIVSLLFIFAGPSQAWRGAAVLLGAGEELCLDLPLEADSTYEISIKLRTEFETAVAAMTLRYHLDSRDVDYKTVIRDLGPIDQWQELSMTITTPSVGLCWQLVITAEQKGMYWWDSLAVARKEGKRSQAFWDEKLAAQGSFYTGLIVDARHLPLQRGMSPRIYSESGQLIYGGVLAPQGLVQEQGVVAYGRELSPELLNRLQLELDYDYLFPLFVKASGVVEPTRTSVYISEEDTQKILKAMVQYDFLARYAVIFLVD